MFDKCKPNKPRRPRLSSIVYLCVFCVLYGFLPGCDTTPQSRLETAKYVVEQGEQKSRSLDLIITEIQTSMNTWQAILSDPNLPIEEKEKILSLLAAGQDKLASAKALKAKIDALIIKSQEILDRALAGEDIGDSEWSAYAELVAAIGASIGGKWGIYGALAASIIGLVFSILKQLNIKKEAKKVVESVDVLLNSQAVINEKAVIDGKEVIIEKPVINKTEAKKILAAEQDTSTVNFVHELKKV